MGTAFASTIQRSRLGENLAGVQEIYLYVPWLIRMGKKNMQPLFCGFTRGKVRICDYRINLNKREGSQDV